MVLVLFSLRIVSVSYLASPVFLIHTSGVWTPEIKVVTYQKDKEIKQMITSMHVLLFGRGTPYAKARTIANNKCLYFN